MVAAARNLGDGARRGSKRAMTALDVSNISSELTTGRHARAGASHHCGHRHGGTDHRQPGLRQRPHLPDGGPGGAPTDGVGQPLGRRSGAGSAAGDVITSLDSVAVDPHYRLTALMFRALRSGATTR
jgi:hypothetical protein